MINIIGDKSILINKRNDCEPKKEIVLKDDFSKKRKQYYNIIKLKENYKEIFLDGEYVLEVIDDSNYIKYISINGDSVEKLLSQKNDQYRLLIDNILGNKL
ncbi:MULTISPECIES: calcium-binding protein [Clostridium]|uniref:Putative hepA/SNF2 n=1 Tax=Clostridium sporogenes TaxID=1509 RepID=A0A1J1CS44_CLOSG|nr:MULTISPECIES: calcium-binding protein [Clostridium]APF25316.1 putative hepA/SNF2 [Clostridium sporogenes]APH15159.1 putative hepA/SNF2 [Clostridium sporogenes]MBD5639584.1 calcium-binding protein [Clostridium botulinum]MDI6918950.1 calcium-binding protein [Clostridium botulinum]WMU99529.1 calcium-binding protein [Clostridium botulinum]